MERLLMRPSSLWETLEVVVDTPTPQPRAIRQPTNHDMMALDSREYIDRRLDKAEHFSLEGDESDSRQKPEKLVLISLPRKHFIKYR